MNPSTRAASHRSRVYYQLSKYYESVFARFFRDRVRAAISNLEIPRGAKVLEIGVGTGLSLAAYPEHADVIGVDLSQEMLNHAQEKIDESRWQHIELREMDAQALDFPDEQFDYVMAFHVVSVVPDYRKMVDEMVRVAKPDATILIVNHFRSRRRLIASAVDMLDGVTRHLGWRTTLKLEDVLEDQPLEVESQYKTSRRSLFTVVQARKTAGAPTSATT